MVSYTMLNPIGDQVMRLSGGLTLKTEVVILSFTGNAEYNTAYWDTMNFRTQEREAGVQIAGGIVLMRSPTGQGGRNHQHCEFQHEKSKFGVKLIGL